ncbi:MAG: formylglycine-generating enzyme family protein [Chloroflexi bacterium]|nr:formylglycine-generating enzyme family protein [Chloroflexota bacterium]
MPGGPFWLDNWQKNGRGDWYTGLDQPYWLGQYPVTAAQFREFVQESDYKPAYDERPLRLPDNWPVVWINWYDALAFTEWLDARWRGKGWLPEGYRLTLPSEVEWEKAARGGQEIPQTPQILTADRLLSLSKQALPTRPMPERDRI